MYVGGFAEDEDGGCAYDITIINNQILECGSKDSEMVTFDRCNKVTFNDDGGSGGMQGVYSSKQSRRN